LPVRIKVWERAGLKSGEDWLCRLTSNPTGTINARQLNDLQTLVNEAALWNLSPDIANLAGKVASFDYSSNNYAESDLPRPGRQMVQGHRPPLPGRLQRADLEDRQGQPVRPQRPPA
jgi:hypothetical protein